MGLKNRSNAKPLWRRRLSHFKDWLIAQGLVAVLKTIRLLPVDRAVALGGWAAAKGGRFLKENKVGRRNLRAAFPDHSDDEIEALLVRTWNNLGRTGVEYVFLDKIFDFDPFTEEIGRIEVDSVEKFLALRDRDEPAILFTAHLANWELLAVCAATYGLNLTSLFRPPNNAIIARKLNRLRSGSMDSLVPSTTGATYALSSRLEEGGRIGLLVDQFYSRGPKLSFFDRVARTNPTLGVLARRFDCPVYAARCIRLPENRFRLELEGPIDLPRDRSGAVLVDQSMQLVTDIIEGWVREHPEQWLWMHRRWRD